MSKKYPKYPKYIYRGITSDPNTWGMCCSEIAARECAEFHYERERASLRKYLQRSLPYNIGIILTCIAGYALLYFFI